MASNSSNSSTGGENSTLDLQALLAEDGIRVFVQVRDWNDKYIWKETYLDEKMGDKPFCASITQMSKAHRETRVREEFDWTAVNPIWFNQYKAHCFTWFAKYVPGWDSKPKRAQLGLYRLKWLREHTEGGNTYRIEAIEKDWIIPTTYTVTFLPPQRKQTGPEFTVKRRVRFSPYAGKPKGSRKTQKGKVEIEKKPIPVETSIEEPKVLKENEGPKLDTLDDFKESCKKIAWAKLPEADDSPRGDVEDWPPLEREGLPSTSVKPKKGSKGQGRKSTPNKDILPLPEEPACSISEPIVDPTEQLQMLIQKVTAQLKELQTASQGSKNE